MSRAQDQRTVGLLEATGVGVGAIVGGGILILAGTAFATSGPAAIIAFAVNGLIAVLTAFSFAEMATTFPISGGGYAFAKKVLSVRAAFGVGWVLWFAYIVAAVLYALGFASYATEGAAGLGRALGWALPIWANGRTCQILLALAASGLYTLSLYRKVTGGGQVATVGKVVVLVILLAVGLLALSRQPIEVSQEALTPILPHGIKSLLAAMGFTFIALQGFDLIAAVAGEIKDPTRNIPRAMLLSLGLALAIYLPLLLVVATVGIAPGESITELAREAPETLVAVAAGHFMGIGGYWLVVIAAILATLSALHANLLAASRIALAMARDRTLPIVLDRIHPERGTPTLALFASALAVFGILLVLPDVSAAGAAASLIFLIAFALVHWTAILCRRRIGPQPGAFQVPGFPWVPAAAGLACLLLAAFQAFAVPSAGAIALLWLGVGALLYVSIFSARAEATDASEQAFDPELARSRGRRSLVLLPVANPARAAALIEVANALAPINVGRVVLLTILPLPESSSADEQSQSLSYAESVLRQGLMTSFADGRAPEALVTAAAEPWVEIRRIAHEHSCDSLLLGLGPLALTTGDQALETLINEVDCHVAIMRAPAEWSLAKAKKVLVPVGGRGEQHELRGRLLGSLCRDSSREITFLRILGTEASKSELEEAKKQATSIALDQAPGRSEVRIIRSEQVSAVLLEQAAEHDLVVLGLRRSGRRATLGDLAPRLAREAPCATILISRRRRTVG